MQKPFGKSCTINNFMPIIPLFKKQEEFPQIPTDSTNSEQTPEPTQVPQEPQPSVDEDRVRRLTALGYR